MQECFQQLGDRWSKANTRRAGLKFGLRLKDDGADLTNLRFADDVILVAQSRSDVKKMLTDLSTTASKFGLQIHYGKTRVMTWNGAAFPHASVSVAGNGVKILPETESERYLGRKLSFADCYGVELNNRIASAWAAFHNHKSELCSRYYRLTDRVKLFDAVVSSAALYGSAAWALTQKQEKKLITVRRTMLRYVFCIHRSKDEDWPCFLKRAACKVEEIAEQKGMESWVVGYRRRKWRFAGCLANRSDERWSKLVAQWNPNHGIGRNRGAPWTRWSDQLQCFAGGDWMSLALDEKQWEAAEEIFINWDFSRQS